LQLLDLPLVFSQASLLTPDDFVREANERGIKLRTAQLLELHRRRALVPLYRIGRRRQPGSEAVPVAESVSDAYRGRGTPLDFVVQAANMGQLIDPAAIRFRDWSGGLRLPAPWGTTTYPSVCYSRYQLLALRAVEALTQHMDSTYQAEDHNWTFHLDPLTRDEIAIMDGCRQLAILLNGLDMHYLPQILLKISHSDRWQESDAGFEVRERVALFGLTSETLARTADALLMAARWIDPMGQWYELIRQAHPSTWEELKGNARLAMDYRVASELLLRTVDDLGRSDLSTAPPRQGRMGYVVLDDRLRSEPERLGSLLTDRGLSPTPAVLLVLEGQTETLIMPRVLAELFGGPVPPTLIELVNMMTVDRDLDLLIRHEIAPRLGDDYGDFVFLARPPTRVLIAVDAEKRYRTPAMRETQRQKLVNRLFESLEPRHRTPRAQQDLDGLVEVTTWGRHPWEFANFTNEEIARGIMSCTTLPAGITRSDLLIAVRSQRLLTTGSANVSAISRLWPQKISKIALAEALWPRFQAKVLRDVESGPPYRVPAVRVGVRALRSALSTHRRHVVLPLR
jgi:hypothetical protein